MAQHSIWLGIESLPEYHATGSDIYVAGSFNGWNAGDADYRFSRDEQGKYYIILNLADGSYEYKITRGGWDKVECREGGSSIDNRILKITGNEKLKLKIAAWSDRYPDKPKISTASKNVQVIDTDFLIPQLKRTRRVWIYLPPEYHNTKNRYPVLYLQDGQNVFDEATAFAGEWGVDEFLDTTRSRKSIVVAIDNGGMNRMTEYNPYDHPKFGKAEGNQYTEFLVKTLKPFIDSQYRTQKDKASTFIAGSSLGGLISFYALLKYPSVFGGGGIFSPSFWLAPGLYNDIQKKGKAVNAKIYFYCGRQEGLTMTRNMLKVYEAMRGVSASKMESIIRKEGKHNEADWRKEFPLFYKWMMQGGQ